MKSGVYVLMLSLLFLSLGAEENLLEKSGFDASFSQWNSSGGVRKIVGSADDPATARLELQPGDPYEYIVNAIGAKPGQEYLLEWEVQSSGNVRALVQLVFYRRKGTGFEKISEAILWHDYKVIPEFTIVSKTFTTPPETVSVQIKFQADWGYLKHIQAAAHVSIRQLALFPVAPKK